MGKLSSMLSIMAANLSIGMAKLSVEPGTKSLAETSNIPRTALGWDASFSRRIKMKIQYSLRIHKAEEGGYWAEFPDLPGCVTEGDTVKETLDNAQEALSGWLASRFERNFEIPTASSVKGKNVYLVEPSPEVGIPLILRKIRTESGLSQKEVAKKLEITYQTYQMWEKPASANPTIKQLAKVASAVGKKLVLEIA
jgi:antitoxin HicB